MSCLQVLRCVVSLVCLMAFGHTETCWPGHTPPPPPRQPLLAVCCNDICMTIHCIVKPAANMSACVCRKLWRSRTRHALSRQRRWTHSSSAWTTQRGREGRTRLHFYRKLMHRKSRQALLSCTRAMQQYCCLPCAFSYKIYCSRGMAWTWLWTGESISKTTGESISKTTWVCRNLNQCSCLVPTS